MTSKRRNSKTSSTLILPRLSPNIWACPWTLTNKAFNYLINKIWDKIKGWKEKNLPFTGRWSLIKAVTQVIPTYTMSYFMNPKAISNRLESILTWFWWGRMNFITKSTRSNNNIYSSLRKMKAWDQIYDHFQ